ncbi:hypothetical protein AHAS_Ahas10G0145500 [Arachis hypogaea]
MDQRPNSTNTTNTASLELLPLFKESKEQEDESIIRRKRSSSCFVDQPSKMSRSKLLYKAVFFQGCRFSSSWKRKDVRKILKRKVSDAGEKVIDEGCIAQQSFWMFLLIDSWLFRHAIALLSRFCSNN